MKHRNNGKARIDDAKLEKVRKLKPSRRASSGKGALIKGMTKRLPSEILGNPLFREGLRSIMRGYAGIYALYRGDKLYYVGLTRNLFGRIRWHRRDRHARKWDSFVIFRIRRVNYLKDIETLLMQLVNTPGNRVKGKVPRDADINRVLRVILREETAEIRKSNARFGDDQAPILHGNAPGVFAQQRRQCSEIRVSSTFIHFTTIPFHDLGSSRL